MICEGKFEEGYDLYVLDALEDAERREIQSHLDSGCETCGKAVRSAVKFWPSFSVSAANEAAPSADLRQRVLGRISQSRVVTMPGRARRFLDMPAWRQAVAAALLLAAGGTLGWWVNRSAPPPRPVVEQAERAPIPQNPDVPRLQAQVDELKDQLTRASAKQEPVQDTQAASRALAALQSELAAAKAQYAAAAVQLSQAQAELQQNRTLLATAQSDRTALEDRLRASVEDTRKGAVEREQIAERERSLAARNRELENQVAVYKAVVDRESKRNAPLFRMAGMLNSPSIRLLHLKGAAGHQAISGSALIDANSGVVLYASGLPALPQGRTYQLWLMRRQGPGIVSGGVFQPDQSGRAVIEVSPSQLTSGITTVAVTDEPAGGSPLPTGTKFLIGVA